MSKALLLLTCAAFALWLATLTQRSVWADELATTVVLEQPDLPTVLQVIPALERRPPLYFVLLWLWTRAAGQYEFALRYFSLCFVTLSLPTSYALARSFAKLTLQPSDAIPLLTAVLIAFSPALALYGVMIRYYSFVLCLALLLNLIFVNWLRLARKPVAIPKGERLTLFSTIVVARFTQQYERLTHARLQRQQLLAILGWFVTALMLIYTDYSSLALIAVQTLVIILQYQSQQAMLRRWVVLLVALVLAYTPLLPNLLAQSSSPTLAADLSRDALGVALKLAYPFFSFTFGETILPWHLTVLVATPFVALAIIQMLRVEYARRLLAMAAPLALIPILFNTFILTAIAADLTFLTIASRTLFVLPLFAMLLATGIVVLPSRWRALSMGLLVLANGFALFNLFAGEQYHNPIYAVPLRSIAEMVQHESQAGDLIMSDYDIAFHYYWRQQLPVGTQLIFPDRLGAEAVKNIVQSGQAPRIWLLVFGRDRTLVGDHTAEIQDWLTRDYMLRGERGYVPVDLLYRTVKNRLVGRETYSSKLLVQLFVRNP